MVENYTKDIKESVYHGAVVSVLAVGYTMLGKTLIKMSPPSLSKFDIEDGVKLVGIVALSDTIRNKHLCLRNFSIVCIILSSAHIKCFIYFFYPYRWY